MFSTMTKTVFGAVMAVGLLTSAAQAGDATAGKKAFNKCKVCHTLKAGEKNRMGPNLHGLFGRAAGTVEGFKYRSSLPQSGIVWDEETLSEWIKNPKAVVKDTKMTISEKNDEKRANIIAYLKVATAAE